MNIGTAGLITGQAARVGVLCTCSASARPARESRCMMAADAMDWGYFGTIAFEAELKGFSLAPSDHLLILNFWTQAVRLMDAEKSYAETHGNDERVRSEWGQARRGLSEASQVLGERLRGVGVTGSLVVAIERPSHPNGGTAAGASEALRELWSAARELQVAANRSGPAKTTATQRAIAPKQKAEKAKVCKQAESLVKRGGAFPGVRGLAKRFKCSFSLMSKIVNDSAILKPHLDARKASLGKVRARRLSVVDIDNTASPVDSHDDDALDREHTWKMILRASSPKERKRLEAYSPEQRANAIRNAQEDPRAWQQLTRRLQHQNKR